MFITSTWKMDSMFNAGHAVSIFDYVAVVDQKILFIERFPTQRQVTKCAIEMAYLALPAKEKLQRVKANDVWHNFDQFWQGYAISVSCRSRGPKIWTGNSYIPWLKKLP